MKYVTYSQLIDWADINEIIVKGDLSLEDLKKMWNALPKSIDSVGLEEEGISVDAFLSLNEAIEDKLLSFEINEEGPVEL